MSRIDVTRCEKNNMHAFNISCKITCNVVDGKRERELTKIAQWKLSIGFFYKPIDVKLILAWKTLTKAVLSLNMNL